MSEDEGVLLDTSEYDRWLASAWRSVVIAEDLDRLERHEAACFYAEQGAQLALKGLLRGLGLASFGHDLIDLGRRLAGGLETDLPDDLRRTLSRLSRYYIPTRYPDAWAAGTPGDHYGRQDSKEALADARETVAAMESIWEQLVAGSEEADEG